jgi:hypothetical protein
VKVNEKAALLLLFVAGMGMSWWASPERARAQTISPPIMIQSAIPHTACAVTASITTYCFASDGLYVSLAGAAFVPINAPAGVTSVTVCNAAGAVCAPAATGAVTLNIPKTASLQ